MFTQVDDKIFRIHDYFFLRDSLTFATMISSTATASETMNGTSDKNPIRLKGQNIGDLENFLTFLYP